VGGGARAGIGTEARRRIPLRVFITAVPTLPLRSLPTKLVPSLAVLLANPELGKPEPILPKSSEILLRGRRRCRLSAFAAEREGERMAVMGDVPTVKLDRRFRNRGRLAGVGFGFVLMDRLELMELMVEDLERDDGMSRVGVTSRSFSVSVSVSISISLSSGKGPGDDARAGEWPESTMYVGSQYAYSVSLDLLSCIAQDAACCVARRPEEKKKRSM